MLNILYQYELASFDSIGNALYKSIWRKVCRESVHQDMDVQESCIEDDSRSITVVVQAKAVNRLSVVV